VRGRIAIAVLAVTVAVASCGSGPSAAALKDNRPPATTTTTEPPAEGIVVIRISNGAFRPAILKIDCSVDAVVEWRHEDSQEREYVLQARGKEFTSPLLVAGDTFQFAVCELEPGLYRYFAEVGRNRIPGMIDSRPSQ